MQYKASIGKIRCHVLYPFAVYYNDDDDKLKNVTVILLYQIIYCMIRMQFTVLFH